jgi:carbonic anhydrase
MNLLRIIAMGALALTAGAAMAAEHGSHWTYEGAEGPEHWGELKEEYAACSKGLMQSPVDLSEADASGAIAFTVDYKPVPLTIFNNGHTVQFNITDGGKLTENGVDYPLVQVHFHAPSEHTVKTTHMPLEAHFVHKAADGTLSVLGSFIEEGPENAALAAVLKHLPEQAGEPTTFADTTIDPNALLPQKRGIYRYMGSLTTPPCSEGVNWHVFSEPVTASKEQIETLTKVLHMNARPVQPLHHRLLVSPAS